MHAHSQVLLGMSSQQAVADRRCSVDHVLGSPGPQDITIQDGVC